MNWNEIQNATDYILPKLKTVPQLEEFESWGRQTIKSLWEWDEWLKLYLMSINGYIWEKIESIIYWID